MPERRKRKRGGRNKAALRVAKHEPKRLVQAIRANADVLIEAVGDPVPDPDTWGEHMATLLPKNPPPVADLSDTALLIEFVALTRGVPIVETRRPPDAPEDLVQQSRFAAGVHVAAGDGFDFIPGLVAMLNGPRANDRLLALAAQLPVGNDGLALLTLAVERYLPDTGDRPILAAATVGASYREDALPTVDPGPVPADGQLPLFDRGKAPAGYGALVAYDAGGAKTWERGGVSIAARLFIESLLFAQSESVLIEPTLREIVAAIWPNGWRRGADLPRLIRALEEVHCYAIPWQQGAAWRPVTVRTAPTMTADLETPIVFDVRLPAGTNPGARVHRPTLHRLGVLRAKRGERRIPSAATWRLYLSLCAYWDRRGYRDGGWNVRLIPEVKRDRDGRILDCRGKPLTKQSGYPVRKWSDPRAVRTGKRIEPHRQPATLNTDDLRRMVFPHRRGLSATALRQQRKTAREALATLKRLGIVDTIQDGGRVRVYRRDGDLRSSSR